MLNNEIQAGADNYAGYYQTVRSELLDLLESGPQGAVLEIGCGGGSNLAELKRRNPGCRTVGVEARSDAATHARGLVDELVEGDVLQVAADHWRGQFDVIVLSHVLEHFAEPAAVLKLANAWLKPEGRLLIALPNIRHISVLVPLLIRGEFRYQPSGILDHTHLRFYTRSSAVGMLADAGWRVLRCEPEFGGGKSRALRIASFGLATDFAAYAYNFLVCRA